MHKPTLYEFHEAVTTAAARQFAESDQEPGDRYETVRDKLWTLLENNRWPIAKDILTDEGRQFFDSLAERAEAKAQQLVAVDQQR